MLKRGIDYEERGFLTRERKVYLFAGMLIIFSAAFNVFAH
jgi:hypothetical protein